MFDKDKRLRRMIRGSFGKNPLEGNFYYDASDRMDRVARFHAVEKEKVSEELLVDDITWNDLEMDQVFLRMNHTNSFVGEQMLYHKLHVLDLGKDSKKADTFKGRLAYLDNHDGEREDVEVNLCKIGKNRNAYYLAEFLYQSDRWKIGNSLFYLVLQLLFFGLFLSAIIFDQELFLVLAFFSALFNLIVYLYTKSKYEVYLESLADFCRIFQFAAYMEKHYKDNDLLLPNSVREAISALKGMNRIAKGLNVRRQNTMTGDVLALLYDYIWGITLFDVALFNRVMKVINNKEKEVLTLFAYAGQLDLLVSVLSYRKSMGIFCEPDFDGAGIDALALAHPILPAPVRNDFTLNDRAMITGVNASGKSTFMKSVAMAAIMSQSVLTVSAKAFSLKPVSVYTCMSLRDDILTGESYYFREARYLKRLLDVVKERDDVLIVLDEMLKGTNTKERVAASKAILSYIVKHKCFCLVATHDNELTRDKAFMNYHFRSIVKNGDMTFTYKIYEGVNTESNAINLLDLLGYPKEIVAEARRNVSA